MKKFILKTPKLDAPDENFNDVISPTKPLNFSKSTNSLKTSLTKTSSKSKFRSQHSLSSLLSQDTQKSLNSYETAMEFDNNSSTTTSDQEDTIEADNSASTAGLGIRDLSLEESADIISNYHSKSTISVYNDELTPKLNNNFNSSVPNSLEIIDDPTPKVQSNFNFVETTPIILQQPQPYSETPKNIPPSSPQTSIISNFITETTTPIQVKRIYESPNKELIKSKNPSPSKSISNFDTSTFSHETTFLEKLQKTSSHSPKKTSPIRNEQILSRSTTNNSNQISRSSKFIPKPEDYSLTSLFVIALHSFDSNTLELNSDSSICLSFEKNDVIFVHSVDSSGWAEVTLIKSLKRGWVPINFFTELVKDEKNLPLRKSRTPLRNLLISGAIFLNNPTDNIENGEASFSINHINNIRDGVRDLLEKTDCLSRSTDIVKKKPIIRRMRKSLLADWYSLMIKADSYKHSKNLVHLETLQLMVLQVIKKSITFLEIWGIESQSLRKEEQDLNVGIIKPMLQEAKTNKIKYLRNAPFAKSRLNEIHNILFNYVGLLLGRLDMIEHNPVGCQVLENITHQMILLLREILFISKSCVLILNDRKTKNDNKFDDNLDTLLSLVSDLVSGVKNFVTKTINDDFNTSSVKVNDGLYYYTPEGDELIGIISRMTRSISSSIESCFKNLALIGDFRLAEDKKYPDFEKIQITPEEFIKTCSVGMIKALPNKEKDLKNIDNRNKIKRQSRFSMVRSGLGNDNSLTTSGTNLLQEFLPDSKSFIRSSVFEPFLTDSNEDYQIDSDIQEEIVRDSNGRLIGASFRALVFTLTDELNKPDGFFISTFFLTFRTYSNGIELIEELITRFNLTNKTSDFEDQEEIGEYSSYESRLKNRRKIVCKMFQIWLQSYWDYINDYNLLPTLINFFNEGVSLYLPIESKRLIELCSKLTVLTPSKIKDSRNLNKLISSNSSSSLEPNSNSLSLNSSSVQLVQRSYTNAKHSSSLSHSSSVYSISSLNKELDDDDYIFEEYELAKLNTANRSSMLLPLPGISFKSNSLLSKTQVLEIENLVLIYRRNLTSNNWAHDSYLRYYPIELQNFLNKWYEISQLKSSRIIKVNYNLSDLNSFELAKQLTIIESKIFLSIKSEELLNNNYTQKKSKLNMSPNISKSLLFTNQLSEYILDSILDSNLNTRKRISRIRNWLNVALSCYYLKNFNSLAAIIITLQNHILSRLDELWDNLPEKYLYLFEDLKKIIHPNNNYKGYRYKISKIFEESETKSPTPLVPYITLFLQDLTFIDEGNKDFRTSNSFLRGRIVNFDKFLRISKVISNLEYLQVGYDNSNNSSMKQKNRRNSIFTLSSSISNGNEDLSPILPLEEFILLEFWKVNQLNLNDSDRNWDLSKKLKD